MSGNLARRRQTKFMPADSKLIEARPPAAQGSVRRVARSHPLLRLLGPRLRLRQPGQLSDKLDAAASVDAAARASANPCVSGGREQKENISLTAYAGFPVAPIFMIWSFDWGSAWIRSPCASTALSTHIFLDDVASLWVDTRPSGQDRLPCIPRHQRRKRTNRSSNPKGPVDALHPCATNDGCLIEK
jgi:hypothetical protein